MRHMFPSFVTDKISLNTCRKYDHMCLITPQIRDRWTFSLESHCHVWYTFSTCRDVCLSWFILLSLSLSRSFYLYFIFDETKKRHYRLLSIYEYNSSTFDLIFASFKDEFTSISCISKYCLASYIIILC
jgi:hypothetical protein